MPTKKDTTIKNYKDRKAMIDLRNKVIAHHNNMNGLLVLNDKLSKELLLAIRCEALAIVIICDETIDFDTDD